jgi:acetamidase/formamidase
VRSFEISQQANFRLCEVALLGHRSRSATHESEPWAIGCFGTHASAKAPPARATAKAPNETCALFRGPDLPLVKCRATGKAGGQPGNPAFRNSGKEKNGYAGRSRPRHGRRRALLHAVRPDAFNYVWDNSIEPELEIDSGEVVEFRVRDASDEQLRADSTSEDVAKLDFDHLNPVSGPVYVRDARPGDVLAVEILEFRPREWGWTALIPGFGLLADEFPEPWLRISRVDADQGRVIFTEGIELPYEPFPGTIGVAPAEPGPHSIVPPSRWGGNMDTKHLRAGTTLYLPVGVEGALFSVGDTHSAQGDGEVCGTAIETAMDVSLRLSVRRDFRVDAPQYRVPPGALPRAEGTGYHVSTGVAPDLMEATKQAVRATMDHLGEGRGFSREEAYALCSVAVDLRIHEVVDAPNWVVGAFLPDDIFTGGGNR